MDLCNYTIWVSRDGRAMKIKDMDSNHFHNLVVYIFTESKLNDYLKNYLPVMESELKFRQLDLAQILQEGARPYTNHKGLEVLWDELTNEDLPIN